MSTVVSKVQFQLDLEPSITEQFRTFKEVIAAAVYGCRIGLSGVASHCDLSPSALSRMLNLNEDDPRHLPADLVPKIIEATQDFRPIHWLVAKYLPDAEWRHRAAVTQLESLLPQLAAVTAQLHKGKR
jgi:hypothetical protein